VATGRGAHAKTYILGPALSPPARVSSKASRSLRAQKGAEALFGELGIPVLLTTLIGDEVLALVSINDESGRGPGMRVGERIPLVRRWRDLPRVEFEEPSTHGSRSARRPT